MTKSERNQIIKWVNTLTNEELEKYYYADDPELKNILGTYLGL